MTLLRNWFLLQWYKKEEPSQPYACAINHTGLTRITCFHSRTLSCHENSRSQQIKNESRWVRSPNSSRQNRSDQPKKGEDQYKPCVGNIASHDTMRTCDPLRTKMKAYNLSHWQPVLTNMVTPLRWTKVPFYTRVIVKEFGTRNWIYLLQSSEFTVCIWIRIFPPFELWVGTNQIVFEIVFDSVEKKKSKRLMKSFSVPKKSDKYTHMRTDRIGFISWDWTL